MRANPRGLCELLDNDEFLIVYHGALNSSYPAIEDKLINCLNLSSSLLPRRGVLCLEGDIGQLPDGTPILVHHTFFPVSQKRFNDIKKQNQAGILTSVLSQIADYTKSPGSKLVICLEVKPATSKRTIDHTVGLLKDFHIDNAYFDSFFPSKLELVDKANASHHTSFPLSYHIASSIGNAKLWFPPPPCGYNILVVPYTNSIGLPNEQLIYGTVRSVDILEKIAKNRQVIGAYNRLDEGNSLVMALNSITHTKWTPNK